jgi:hypothetical protein
MNEWHTTFLGVRQQHNYALYRCIDEILRDSPIERFVEIGTGGGALSVVLGLHAVQRGTHLLTFDYQIRGDKPKLDAVFDALGIEFAQADAFNNKLWIYGHMEEKPCFFFCDGNDKPLEFNTFAPLLAPGSIIAAHDLGDEFDLYELETTGLLPIMEERWNEETYKLRTCFFRKEES